jgi:hypothetical protein
MQRRIFILAGVLALGACSINDSRTATRAQKALLGMNEVQLQTCMGAPDEKNSFGATEILTYYATSTSSTTTAIPLIGGISETHGGYCHTIIRIDHDVVDSVRYAGEINALIAPNAYCAPSVRGCVNNPPPPGMPGQAASPVAIRPEA